MMRQLCTFTHILESHTYTFPLPNSSATEDLGVAVTLQICIRIKCFESRPLHATLRRVTAFLHLLQVKPMHVEVSRGHSRVRERVRCGSARLDRRSVRLVLMSTRTQRKLAVVLQSPTSLFPDSVPAIFHFCLAINTLNHSGYYIHRI
jgi:hypothetical protein